MAVTVAIPKRKAIKKNKKWAAKNPKATPKKKRIVKKKPAKKKGSFTRSAA